MELSKPLGSGVVSCIMSAGDHISKDVYKKGDVPWLRFV